MVKQSKNPRKPLNGTAAPVVTPLPKLSKVQHDAMTTIQHEIGYFDKRGYPKAGTYESLAVLGLVKRVSVYVFTDAGYEWAEADHKAWYKEAEERNKNAPARNELEAYIRTMSDSEREQLNVLLQIMTCTFPGMDDRPISCEDKNAGVLTMRENLMTSWVRSVPEETSEKVAEAIRVKENEKKS